MADIGKDVKEVVFPKPQPNETPVPIEEPVPVEEPEREKVPA